MRPGKKSLRYIVTGPGIEGTPPSYAEVGPAISRTITAAERSTPVEGTWYARDAITGDIVGRTEVIEVGGTLVTATYRN